MTYAEVIAARADPERLVCEEVLERDRAEDVEALEGDEPNSLRCRATNVFRALAERNGLAPLTSVVSMPFVGVGLLRRRGLALPVVWLRPAARGLFQTLCSGLRVRLGHDGLIVLVPRDLGVPFAAAERIAVVELLDDTRGNLGLARALDELTPGHRERALTDQTLDLDHIHLRFATVPGERHVVTFNGHADEGFRRSDLKFLRLLLLAAARKQGADDGWVDKSRLRDADDKDRGLVDLRHVLSANDTPGLDRNERRALIKVQRGSGLIRLGVPPENIAFDASLKALSFVGSNASIGSDGTKRKATIAQEEGLQNAAALLRECRRLGVPGDVAAIETKPRTE